MFTNGRYLKRVKMTIAYHNKFMASRQLPYWAKVVRAVLDTADQRLFPKFRHWFYKVYLFNRIGE